MRRGASHRVFFYRRLPDVYPIFLILSPRGAEGLCAELPTIVHTLGRRKALSAPRYLINLRVEPRASSPPHRAPVPTTDSMYRAW